MQYLMEQSSTVGQRIALAAVLFVAGLVGPGARAAEPRVPYVPTPQEVVERMLEMAKVTAKDYLIDLGSGDGRIVVTAAEQYGARGFGVDINPERIREANEKAKSAGVLDKVAFYQRDLFETDLSDASVITMYLLPRVNLELRPKLLELRPGTRIVSHDFSMAEWKADRHVQMAVREKYGGSGGTSDIYYWVVPARVGGTWQWEMPVAGKSRIYRVTLAQKFQVFSGAVRVDGRDIALQGPRLNGERIAFAFTAPVNGMPVKHEFNGTVEADRIFGTARLSGDKVRAELEWSAHHTAKAAMIGADAPTGSAVLHTSH